MNKINLLKEKLIECFDSRIEKLEQELEELKVEENILKQKNEYKNCDFHGVSSKMNEIYDVKHCKTRCLGEIFVLDKDIEYMLFICSISNISEKDASKLVNHYVITSYKTNKNLLQTFLHNIKGF